MVTNGNYGFVVNAPHRMREREGGLNIHPVTTALDYTFNRKFGIEIEAYDCSRERLAPEPRTAGQVRGLWVGRISDPYPPVRVGSS